MMQMEKHITLVGALRIGLSAFVLLGALLVLFGGVALFIVEPTPEPVAIVGLAAAEVLLLILGGVGVAAGVGLLAHKSWARYLSLVLAVFSLFNIPIGTAVAIYTFWVLIQDETAQIFATPSEV